MVKRIITIYCYAEQHFILLISRSFTMNDVCERVMVSAGQLSGFLRKTNWAGLVFMAQGQGNISF